MKDCQDVADRESQIPSNLCHMTTSSSQSPIEITHFLPPLGTLRPKLFNESAAIFRRFAPKEIDRLRSIPQLGIVSRAWEGARHSRWDYVALTMHIVRQAREFPTIGTGGRVSLPGRGSVSSTLELMNCWALLLHAGHLRWTFTAERWLLDEITRHSDAGQRAVEELIESVPEALRDRANDIVQRRRYYEFYKVLAFHRLGRLASDWGQAERWKQILQLYVGPSAYGSSAWRARRSFRRIRRLAFLALDAEYSPSALTLRMHRLISDATQLERVLNLDAGLPSDMLLGLENYLSRHVYLGERSLLEVARVEAAARERIRDGLTSHGITYVVSELADGGGGLGKSDAQGLGVALRLDVTPFLVRSRQGKTAKDPILQSRIGDRWARLHNLPLNFVHHADATGQLHVLQAHTPRGNLISRAGALVYGISALLRFTEQEMESPFALLGQRLGMQDAISRLVTEALWLFFPWDESNWRMLPSPSGLLGLVGTRTALSELLRDDQLTQDLDRSDVVEVEATADCARRQVHATAQVVVVGNVEAVSRDKGIPQVEIDGVVVSVLRQSRELRITLIEAKGARRAAEGTARRDLLAKTRSLLKRRTVREGRVYSRQLPRGGAAYAYRHYRMRWSRASSS